MAKVGRRANLPESRGPGGNITLGQWLREQREGRTLREVAEASGISASFLSRLEGGLIRRPSDEVLYGLAQGLGVTLEAIRAVAGLTQQTVGTPSALPSLQAVSGRIAESIATDVVEHIPNIVAGAFEASQTSAVGQSRLSGRLTDGIVESIMQEIMRVVDEASIRVTSQIRDEHNRTASKHYYKVDGESSQ